MEALQIRPVQPTDLPSLMAAAQQTGWDHLTPHEQALTTPAVVAARSGQMVASTLQAPGSLCLVAHARGQIAAYELLVLRTDDVSGIPEALKLDGWVAPTHRGRGLNQVMHRLGEDWCRRVGIRRMTCVVAAHNAASLRATDKYGFHTERLIRAKWI